MLIFPPEAIFRVPVVLHEGGEAQVRPQVNPDAPGSARVGGPWGPDGSVPSGLAGRNGPAGKAGGQCWAVWATGPRGSAGCLRKLGEGGEMTQNVNFNARF